VYPPVVDDPRTEHDTPADTAYRWTIRTLYLAAIILNVWVLWDQTQNDTQKAVLGARLKKWGERIMHPIRVEQQIEKETGPMLWEAQTIVETAAAEAEDVTDE